MKNKSTKLLIRWIQRALWTNENLAHRMYFVYVNFCEWCSAVKYVLVICETLILNSSAANSPQDVNISQ